MGGIYERISGGRIITECCWGCSRRITINYKATSEICRQTPSARENKFKDNRIEIVVDWFNKIYMAGLTPEECLKSTFIVLSKTINTCVFSDYRTIQIFLEILQRRLFKALEKDTVRVSKRKGNQKRTDCCKCADLEMASYINTPTPLVYWLRKSVRNSSKPALSRYSRIKELKIEFYTL